MHPHARTDNLDITETAAGLHVYDRVRQEVYSLHPVTSFVWKHADGQTSVADLARLATDDLGMPVDQSMVWSAIDKLAEAGLLRQRLAPPSAPRQVDRRSLMRRIAVGSVAAAGLGFLAERPADAASPGHGDGTTPDVDQKLHELEQEVKQSTDQARQEVEDKRRQAAQEHRDKTEDDRRHPGGTPIALTGDWYSAGAPYQFAAFRQTHDLVVISGLIRPVPNPSSPLIGTLPRDARPAGTVMFGQYASFGGTDQTVRIDIQADGQILLGTGTPDPDGWVSLSGIVFVPYHGHNPSPLNDGDNDSDDGPTQEQQSKITQEQDDKEQASKEQQAKQQAEQQQKQAAEQTQKQQAEQSQKQQAEQTQKRQAEQTQKQQAEQTQKQQAEQAQKQQAEQAAKEQQGKQQSTEEQQKQAAEQVTKEQQAKQSTEQQQKQAGEQLTKEQQAKQSTEQLQKQQAEQAAKEQQAKQAAEQTTKRAAEQQAKQAEQSAKAWR